jgi:hypothetical protein
MEWLGPERGVTEVGSAKILMIVHWVMRAFFGGEVLLQGCVVLRFVLLHRCL